MQTLFSILTVVFALAAFVAATAKTDNYDLTVLCPWFAIPAALCLVVVAFLSRRPSKYSKPAASVTVPEGMPSPAEITERVRRFLENENGSVPDMQPQPPNGAVIQCDVHRCTETYVIGNDAQHSPHLLTHPERCKVIT